METLSTSRLGFHCTCRLVSNVAVFVSLGHLNPPGRYEASRHSLPFAVQQHISHDPRGHPVFGDRSHTYSLFLRRHLGLLDILTGES